MSLVEHIQRLERVSLVLSVSVLKWAKEVDELHKLCASEGANHLHPSPTVHTRDKYTTGMSHSIQSPHSVGEADT